MKINLPIAAKRSQKMPLNNVHVGTTDFFRPFVNYYLETVPKDKINANIKQFVQAYPLVGANLGQYKHNTYAFHVPYRCVMRDFNDFVVHNEVEFYGVDSKLVNLRNLQIGYRSTTPLITRTDLFYALLGFRPLDGVFTDESVMMPFDIQSSFVIEVEENRYYSENLLWKKYISDALVENWDIQISQSDYSVQSESFGGNPLFNCITIINSQDYERVLANSSSNFDSEIESLEQFKRYFDLVGKMRVKIGTGFDYFWVCINFSPYGRYVYQLLESIGYVITFGGYFNFIPSSSGSSSGVVGADYVGESQNIDVSIGGSTLNYSALPLMSLYKVFVDWFVPTKFRNRYDVMLQELYKFQYPFRPYSELGRYFYPFPLIREVLLYTSYSSDYFTDAFRYPNGSNSGESSDLTFSDFTLSLEVQQNLSATQDNSFGNYFNTAYSTTDGLGPGDNVTSPLTSYALRALNALNNFVRRNQIVGYKTIDRYLARYGVKLDPSQSYRSVLISSSQEDVVPLNVMSQSDNTSSSDATPETQQSLLGGRASNLIFSHSSNIQYDNADEFGMFLVVSTLVPKVGYVDGIDRQILHTTYDSFYQGEFDSLGVQPILKGEIFNRFNFSDIDKGNEIFGFTRRYSDYKYKQDKLTGDFIFPSRNAFLDSLHTFRRFVTEPDSINNRFLIGDNSEYDRIFVMTTDEYDHFQTASYNDVTVFRCVDSASDVSDITDGYGDVEVHEGGNNVLH